MAAAPHPHPRQPRCLDKPKVTLCEPARHREASLLAMNDVRGHFILVDKLLNTAMTSLSTAWKLINNISLSRSLFYKQCDNLVLPFTILSGAFSPLPLPLRYRALTAISGTWRDCPQHWGGLHISVVYHDQSKMGDERLSPR